MFFVIANILFNHTLANEISNAIDPVSYFSGREVELREMDLTITNYRKVSLVGISGVGKSQLIRKFIQNKDYKIVWFFDCNKDLNIQYFNLAKYINNKLKNKSFVVDEDYDKVKVAVLNYLKSQKNWLFVYDNLKISQNHLIEDIINLESKGEVIIGSQDADKLPNVIYIHPLNEVDSKTIIKKILPNEDASYLNNIFKGYPLLIAQGSMLLKNSSYNAKDYKSLLTKQEYLLKSHINFIINKLTPSAQELLYKIVIINNQSFSKKFLLTISNYHDNFDEDLSYLIQLGLVANIYNSQNNEIFELHEAIKDQVISLLSMNYIKNIISDAITKATKIMPHSSNERRKNFADDQTLIFNLEKLLANAELYKLRANNILSLREKLITHYVSQRNFIKCKDMAQWISKFKDNYWQLWLMNEDDKAQYASYLNYVSMYEDWANGDLALSIELKEEAKDILIDIKDNNEHKLAIFVQLTQHYIITGNVDKAEENLALARKFINNKHQEEIIWLLKARILLCQSNFTEALTAIDKSIAITRDLYPESYAIPSFIIKARIFNYLNRYQESYEITNKIYLQKKDDQQFSKLLFSSVLTDLSNALLNMNKVADAHRYIVEAKNILLNISQQKIDTSSQDWRLASVLKIEGDCLLELGEYQKAIDHYAQAEAIFYNVYKENMKNNPILSSLYLNGLKAACIIKSRFWFNKFKNQQMVKFGTEHPSTIEVKAVGCF